MGEITPIMAAAIADSSAMKMILPMNRCGIYVAGTKDINLSEMIDNIIKELNIMIN